MRQTTAPDTSKETQSKRKLWDPFFKEFLALPFSGPGASIQTEIEVNRLPQRIDALAILESAAARTRMRANPLLSYLRTYNLFEFKGQNDPLNGSEYHRICMRAYGYLAEHKVPDTEVTLTIVSSRKPRVLLTHPPFGLPWQQLAPGHYHHRDGLPVHLLVCNEVERVEPNYWLLLFASSRKQFRAFLRRVITEENTLYFDLALYLQPAVTEEICEMEGHRDLFQSRLREVATTLGPKLLSVMSLSDMLALLNAMPAEDRAAFLDVIPAEDRAAFLDVIPAEDRAAFLDVIPAEDRAAFLDVMPAEDRANMLARLPAAERADMLARLSPDERIAGLRPEEIRNLSPEVRAELIRQLQAAENDNNT